MAERQSSEIFLQIGDAICAICRESGTFLRFGGELFAAIIDAIKNPRKVKWQTTAYYMDKSGSDAVPIISLLGFLVGVILAFQAIVQLSRYGVESYVVNLVSSVVVTELAPLITAIVLAGRSGSAFAAEIGTMKANEEIDAMVTMGFVPSRYLIIPKVLALLAIMPFLTIFSDICGIIGGMIIACSKLDISYIEYYSKTLDVIKPVDIIQGLSKSVFFALIVASVGCMKGLESGRDAQGVGKASTSAVICAIFFIILADAIITSLFSML